MAAAGTGISKAKQVQSQCEGGKCREKTEPDSPTYTVIGQKASGRRCSKEDRDSVWKKGNLNHEKPHN